MITELLLKRCKNKGYKSIVITGLEYWQKKSPAKKPGTKMYLF